MSFLSCLVLFFLSSLASDLVELEPLKATNAFSCSTYDNNQGYCTASPYCVFLNNKCGDDPCLKYLTSNTDECQALNIDFGGTNYPISCAVETIGSHFVTGADCSGNDGSGFLCRNTLSTAINPIKNHDYCQYAYLRDNKVCPVDICRSYNPADGSININNQCIKNNKGSCSILSTKDECGLVPKCYWHSDSQGCIIDPCFAKGQDCSTYTGVGHPAGPVPAGDCKEYKPYAPADQGGEVQLYCVHKDNKNPNICYLAGNNISLDVSRDDHITYTGNTVHNDGTYPTLEWWTVGGSPVYYGPTCSGALTGCEGAGNCTTIFNKKGALAGAYCSDGTHGGTSMLRIPSLLVFLFVLISMFS